VRFGFITAVYSILKMEAYVRLDWFNDNAPEMFCSNSAATSAVMNEFF
jgi:hypothetical protein